MNWRMEILLPGRSFRRRRLAAGGLTEENGHSDARRAILPGSVVLMGSRAERANSVQEPALGQLFCISAFCYSLAKVVVSPRT